MKFEAEGILPSQLSHLLELSGANDVEALLEPALLGPLRDFLARPSKQIRRTMVEIGFKLVQKTENEIELTLEKKTLLSEAGTTLEMLHAASLVIDDIQDNSLYRRGELTLHRTLGVPSALNAGNWLYFWPLMKVDQWTLSAEAKARVYLLLNRGLLRAHFGQALDIGTDLFNLDQTQIPSVCRASMELKSGALMAMAVSLGALLNEASAEEVDCCSRFGHDFGMGLQMFDDLGNLTKEGPKQFEDVWLKRPSWVMAVAAEILAPAEFKAMQSQLTTVQDGKALLAWLDSHAVLKVATERAANHVDKALNKLKHSMPFLSPACHQELEKMTQNLKHAYV